MCDMIRAFSIAIFAIALLVEPAFAMVTVPTEFREIVADSSVIVRGHVTDVRAVADRDRGIETIGTIAIDETLKGPVRDFVSVRLPGGTIGRYRWTMVGAPSLQSGDQAIFFLKQDAATFWRPVGLAMGIYRIFAAPSTGLPVVDPPVASGITAKPGIVMRGDTGRRTLAVLDFESLVRVVIASQSTAGRQATR
jgi:hypothetical protein